MIDRPLRKQRLSTRERFEGVLFRKEENTCKPLPWYKLRRNYLPLLMIGIFMILWFVIRVLAEGGHFAQEGIVQPTPQESVSKSAINQEE